MIKLEYITLYISGLILWTFYLIIAVRLFEKNEIRIKLTMLPVIMVFSIFTLFSNLIEDNAIKGLISYVLMLAFNKIIFREKWNKTIVGSFIEFILLLSSEAIIAIILSIILKIVNLNEVGIVKDTLIINFIIPLLGYFIIRKYEKFLREILNKNLTSDKGIIVISLMTILTLSILVFKIPITRWNFNSEFLTLMLLLVLFCFIGIYMYKQRTETQKITDKYIKLAEYAKNNEGLLEEYRMNLHENKNRLITIDNMVPAKYKEIHEYIGELIKKNKSNKYYWLTELKYVPSSELKGFMNYKIMEMINDKLAVEVNISRELDKKIIKSYSVKDKEELYSIVGIFLDNAYEASKISKEKAVSIQMFMEKKDCKLIIANTYKGKIDLEKIDAYGYSSKGTNRGTGLHIVSEIVNRNLLFEKETSILDNYFVQTLTLHPKKIKKK